MQHRGLPAKLGVGDAASASRLTRMGRQVFLYVTYMLVSSLILLKVWETVAGGNGQAAHSHAKAAAGVGFLDNSLQQHQAASSVQGIRLLRMPGLWALTVCCLKLYAMFSEAAGSNSGMTRWA